MPPRKRQQLFDPRRGEEAIRILEVAGEPHEAIDPPRTNCFCVFFIRAGVGEFWVDTARHLLRPDALLFITPYQYVRLVPESALQGAVIQFHANFLCVETFHAETGCAGTLFNDPYRPPILTLDRTTRRAVSDLIQQMHREQADRESAYQEMLLAQLKMLLIHATRRKERIADVDVSNSTRPRHPVLAPLKELIEQHYQTLHAPSEYAERLHMSTKSLGRIVREQLGKSLTDLIRERILTHAKWQLLHTLKPVKEVAHEVGFDDELYFSRMFKKATGCSPTFFREFETEIRGGSNLSMTSLPAPILNQGHRDDTSDS